MVAQRKCRLHHCTNQKCRCISIISISILPHRTLTCTISLEISDPYSLKRLRWSRMAAIYEPYALRKIFACEKRALDVGLLESQPQHSSSPDQCYENISRPLPYKQSIHLRLVHAFAFKNRPFSISRRGFPRVGTGESQGDVARC